MVDADPTKKCNTKTWEHWLSSTLTLTVRSEAIHFEQNTNGPAGDSRVPCTYSVFHEVVVIYLNPERSGGVYKLLQNGRHRETMARYKSCYIVMSCIQLSLSRKAQ